MMSSASLANTTTSANLLMGEYHRPPEGHGNRNSPEPEPSSPETPKTPNRNRLGVFVLVGLTGFEPVASSLSGMRSNQLSYSPAALCGVCPAR